MIQLDLKDSNPLYEQIKTKIKDLIISGVLMPDEKIPSVRELAQTLTINPNTIQKAYKELETEGYIYSIIGKGNFIAPLDKNSIEFKRNELFKQLVKTTEELIYLLTAEQSIINVIHNTYKQKEASK
jgi:GntR family transcriptional regulator